MIKSMGITQKIWFSISILVLGYFASMLVGFYLGQQTENRLHVVSESLFPAAKQSQLALSSFKEELNMYYDAVVNGEESSIGRAGDKADEVIAALNVVVHRDDGDIHEIIKRLQVFNKLAKKVYASMVSHFEEEVYGDDDSDEVLAAKVPYLIKESKKLEKLLLDLANSISSDLKNEIFSISSRTKQQRYINAVVFIVVVTIALSLIYVIVLRLISRPLEKTFMLESVVTQSVDGIAVSNIDSSLEFINKSWAHMHGYEMEELIGKKMDSFYTEKQWEDYNGLFVTEVNEKEFKADEEEHLRKNGETFSVMMVMSLLKDSNDIPIKYVHIARDITIQKKNEAELKSAREELLEKAHKAGMADIATGTLHNVGNILNSVKTSTQAIAYTMEKSPITGLNKANQMLRDNIGCLEEFITTNPKAKKLMQYYLKLEDGFNTEKESIKKHLERLFHKVDVIASVISAQQSYAGYCGFEEKAALSDIVNDAVTMQSGSIKRYNIIIIKDLKNVPDVLVQKTKLVHILINLIQNAKDAMLSILPEERKMKIKIESNSEAVFVKVIDSGQGIEKKHIQKIFSHGFTTKEKGHGFGLHSSANYMTEMGGRIWVESEGKDKGATFILRFPL